MLLLIISINFIMLTNFYNYYVVLVDTTGLFRDILIGNQYWIGVVDNYSRYSWILFTKTKYQLPKNMEEFFEKMT